MILLVVFAVALAGFAIPICQTDDVVQDVTAIQTAYIAPEDCAPKVCPKRCKPTCARPNPPNCGNTACKACQNGYIYLNRNNDTCIPIYQCPQNGCNGDKNALIEERVIPCRSTCREPSQGGCSEPIQTGCICKSGYILSRKYGKCIPIEKCPGGNPCGKNQTFVSCSQCIFDGCPTGDLIRYACDPTWPCPAGCACAEGFRRLDGKCILESECPPVPPSDGPLLN